jgi:hypothetical protein
MFFEYWMFTINEFLSVNLLCKTETALWYRCCISVFRRNCSNQLTHSHHTVEDANEHLWRDYTWLISLIDNDIHTRNDREASMDVHLLSVLLLHSEVQEKQYRKHTMWREKITRANELLFERKWHRQWSAEIVYAGVNTTFVTEFVSKVSPDCACRWTMCSAFTDKSYDLFIFTTESYRPC